MTPRTWAEKLARKQTGVTTAQFYYAHALVKEHARSVRIVKRLEKNALDKQEPECTRCYLQGLRDVLAALQRGRTRKG